jgi:hypothetical protein
VAVLEGEGREEEEEEEEEVVVSLALFPYRSLSNLLLFLKSSFLKFTTTVLSQLA